jgi:hypothetical protein
MDSRLGTQLKQLVDALNNARIAFALIGGLALAAHKVIRATQDIDLLIDADASEKINGLLTDLGYRCIHRSDDAGNYRRDDERVDLLYAGRPIARQLLNTAAAQQTSFGILRIVSTEGLIGFKLQAMVNNPRRTQDLEDIRALMRENRDIIDMVQVREYFQLFDRQTLLEELINEIN